MLHDRPCPALAQAWRALARRRAFTFVTILTLAASAGVTTAVFSVVNGVVWRPLVYPDPAELVAVYEANPSQRQPTSLIAPIRLEDWRRLNRTFTAISGSYTESVTDTSGAEPERLDGRRVATGYFDVFRMTPLAGRTFVPGRIPNTSSAPTATSARSPAASVRSFARSTRRARSSRRDRSIACSGPRSISRASTPAPSRRLRWRRSCSPRSVCTA